MGVSRSEIGALVHKIFKIVNKIVHKYDKRERLSALNLEL